MKRDQFFVVSDINNIAYKFEAFIVPTLIAKGQTIVLTPNLNKCIAEVVHFKTMDLLVQSYTVEDDVDQRDDMRKDFIEGKIQFLYATPEMYFSNGFFRDFVNDQVRNNRLYCIVINDAKNFLNEKEEIFGYNSYKQLSVLKCINRALKWVVIGDINDTDEVIEISEALKLSNPMIKYRRDFGGF
uniref:CSON008275 protein n=1 Tax=Culicoides sonorensis TaxID=179676 RepID=A0A336MYU6_CULSO